MKNHIAFGVLALGFAAPAFAQDKHEFSGQFLTNQQGELCTMCEADVVCAPKPPETTPAVEGSIGTLAGMSTGAVKLHFSKRDFLGQMSTVLDYFPLTRKYGLYHSRAVTITQDGGQPAEGKATFNLDTKRIDIANAKGDPIFWINRTTSTWHSSDGAERGVCSLGKEVAK